MKSILLATALSFLILLGMCLAKYNSSNTAPPQDPFNEYVFKDHNMRDVEKYLKDKGVTYSKNPISSYPKGDSFWTVNKSVPKSSFCHLSFNIPLGITAMEAAIEPTRSSSTKRAIRSKSAYRREEREASISEEA